MNENVSQPHGIRPTARQALPFIVGVGFVLLIIALDRIWLPVSYSGDDLQYAMVIEQATSNQVFYHPSGTVQLRADGQIETPASPLSRLQINIRYILEYPTSILAVKIWQAAGWQGNVILPVLWLRIIEGAIGLLFFSLAIRRLSGSQSIALISSLGLATTLTYWTYSTHLDQSISMIMFLCLALYLLTHIPESRAGFILLPVIFALASLYNFTAAIITLVTGLALLAFYKGPFKNKAGKSLSFYLLYGTVVLAVFLIALAFIGQNRTIDLNFFKSASFFGHPEYQFDFPRDILRGILGFDKSQVTLPGYSGSLQALWEQSGSTGKLGILAYYGLIMLFMLVPVVLFVRHFRSLSEARRRFGITLAIWFTAFSLFNFWWDPGYIKYWLIPLTCWWALAGIMLAHAREQLPRWQPFLRTGLVSLVIFSFLVNFLSVFLPESSPQSNPLFNIAADLQQKTQPNDVFISPGLPVDFYITYFARRDLVATGLLAYASGGDRQRIQQVVDEHIAMGRDAGGDLYAISPAGSQPDESPALRPYLKDWSYHLAWSYAGMDIYQLEKP
ncbi:MAG: hypothetical protein AB1453_04230 [Chloroflexota bacterium]|jgi:hypothetical protein